MRSYRRFVWKEADLRICSTRVDVIIEEIKRLRELLDRYIARHPEFQTSLVPIGLLPDAPSIAVRMEEAAELADVGPMAAVAGAVAQMAAETAFAAGAGEAIVENGGDIYLHSPEAVVVGLYAGEHPLSGRLAFQVEPWRMPVSVCSSSSRFGHSLSLGDCDLATVVARDSALADAAATLACNSVQTAADVEAALGRVLRIQGIQGVLIIKGDHVGLGGDLPRLIRSRDAEFEGKTFHTTK